MLDKKNYFALDNHYLTRSKIMDYFKCPAYFYRKHITGEIEQEQKKAFEIGSAVDDLLTQIDNIKNYYVCLYDGRTKDGIAERTEAKEKGYTILSKNDYEQIMGLAIAVQETSAYKELAGHEKQKLLQIDMPLGQHFKGLAALPDFIKIEGTHATITDLKTANDINQRRYWYHCKEYGYLTQFALQTIILRQQGIETFTYRHLTVEKTKDIWNVGCFEFLASDINKESEDLMTKINIIAKDTEFKKDDASFTHTTVLTDPSSEF